MKILRLTFFLILLQATHVLATENDAEPRSGQYSVSTPVANLTDMETRSSLTEVVDVDGLIEWEIYIPANYSPDKPAGVIVFISPTNTGKIPQRWKAVMDRNNLIWIAANQSGNTIMTARRMLFSALALVQIQKQYSVNSDRFYVSGFSGGGRVSSIVAVDLARLFRGAIYICGVNPPREEQPLLLEQMRENHFVFLTGTKDFNESETKRVYRTYRDLGIDNIKLMVIPQMAHRLPNADKYDEAIRFLDSGFVLQD